MSDFLSNFESKNYEQTRQDKLYEKKAGKKEEPKRQSKKSSSRQGAVPQQAMPTRSATEEQPSQGTQSLEQLSVEELLREKKRQRQERQAAREAALNQETTPPLEELNADMASQKTRAQAQATTRATVKATKPVPVYQPAQTSEDSREAVPGEELTEIDPGYRRKKILKTLLILMATAAAIGLGIFGYYQYTHVTVPDFVGKELSEVRAWTAENDVALNVEQEYNFDDPANQIIAQSVRNKKIKKGEELSVDASLGADPEETIALPDFSTMSLAVANEWISANKAEGLTVIEEYNETKPAGEYIKLEMGSKDVTAENYRRQDKAKLYYSKGAEPLEKNIEVTDFVGKTRAEVEEWTKKNELAVVITESDSDTVEAGKVISQEIAKGTKVAKKDQFPIVVSTGKSVTIPDYSQTPMTDAEGSEGVAVKQIYHDTIPYGGFISQSVEPGLKFKEAERPGVQLVYSIGRPFIKDLKESTLEGDLQRIFYEEYQSKGANVTFQVYYMDSASTKGTVVQMSQFNEFVSTNAVIRIGISRGNIVNQETPQPTATDE